MTPEAAYQPLHHAILNQRPPCTGDDRFIADKTRKPLLEHLKTTICDPCPLLELCRAYGDAARPKVGVWGGRTY